MSVRVGGGEEACEKPVPSLRFGTKGPRNGSDKQGGGQRQEAGSSASLRNDNDGLRNETGELRKKDGGRGTTKLDKRGSGDETFAGCLGLRMLVGLVGRPRES